MSSHEIALVDLSGIAHRLYAVGGKEPDPDFCSQQTIAKIRELTRLHPHAAICLDTPPYIKKEQHPEYKAGRPTHEAALYHQMRLAAEELKKDGYPCWGVRGYEADDVIASAVTRALALDPDVTVLIISADKDLLQLVGPRVRALSTVTGLMTTETTVIERFGVTAAQMTDYLCLVGDTSDNIKGARLIGAKNAPELLKQFGSIDAIYQKMDYIGPSGETPPLQLKPATLASLAEFRSRYAEVKSLIQLRTDVPIPFEEIAAERQPPELSAEFTLEEPVTMDELAPVVMAAVATAPPTDRERYEAQMGDLRIGNPVTIPLVGQGISPAGVPDHEIKNTAALAVRIPEVLQVPYERQLDPRTAVEARALATDMHNSHMFSAYGSAPAVLSTILLGRELGLPAMASLRLIYNVDGKHALSADLIVALVLKSGFAVFFEPTAISETSVTFETKRKRARAPVSLTYTIEMAKDAGLVRPGSTWVKDPTSMLIARCKSRLARLIYPDVAGGLYDPEELAEIRRAA